MSMRKQFVQTVNRILANDPRVVLLLGDIGVFGFRDAFAAFPDRVFNIGILEQATVSLAAGLAKTGLIPIVHTIAPFLVERCLEQIKIDFGYQGLGGNFVTVGASYDYAALGCTHHCPGDIQVTQTIPGMEIALPGTAREFDLLFSALYASGRPSYVRLSETENTRDEAVAFGEAALVSEGQAVTIVAVGPVLEAVRAAADGVDATILYYSTIAPFDRTALKRHAASSRKILLCEPYYKGGLAAEITEAMWPHPVLVRSVGVPRRFLTHYGARDEHDVACGLTPAAIRNELDMLLNA
jgi:transketolase